MLVGCTGRYVPAEPAVAAKLAPLEYPAQAELGPDLDVVIQQRGKTLIITNRTARPVGQRQLWINQQWVGLPSALPVGGQERIELSRFVNDRGEQFPTGWLLAPEQGLDVVLAEWYDPSTGLRHRLLVSGNEPG
jgi:hypothetical protein